MTDLIARPTFYEGEILPAGDLVAAVDYARGELARHDRCWHSWGIAFGLDLKATPAQTKDGKKYSQVTVTAGVAADGTGREIVVPDDVQLDPNDLQTQVNAQPKVLYPVYLIGMDQAATASSSLTGGCNASQSTRTQENYAIQYGTAGSELDLDQQAVPAVASGPGDGNNPWKVLLGFVQVSDDVPQLFGTATYLNPMTQVKRRYAGVYAEQVISRGGSLHLANHPKDFTGQPGMLALEIHETPQQELVFGKQNPDGSVTAVLTVSAKGDLTATGKISGAVTPGSVQVQSGIASDGVQIPLPPGITTADQADLHIHVTPRMISYPQPPAVAGTTWVLLPLECYVDDSRRVNCRILWLGLSAGGAPVIKDAPGLCDYTIMAAIAASTG